MVREARQVNIWGQHTQIPMGSTKSNMPKGINASGNAGKSPNTFTQSNGLAINPGSILQGLAHNSKTKPNTGTADGDRAVNDAQKSGFMAESAEASRAIAGQNQQAQQQAEQARQQSVMQNRQVAKQKFDASLQQATSQSQMLQSMKQHRNAMKWNTKNFLGGLIE